jgi:hypothetical protein
MRIDRAKRIRVGIIGEPADAASKALFPNGEENE